MEQRILLCADTNLEERERIRPEWAFANDTKKWKTYEQMNLCEGHESSKNN